MGKNVKSYIAGLVNDRKLSPYAKVLNRYYGGLDIALAPMALNRVNVFFVSYPKSGRTWVKIFLQILFVNQCKEVCFDGNIFGAPGAPNVLFTHTNYYYLPKKTVYILRDPRDVLVSFYYHVRHRGPETMNKYKSMSMSEFVHDKDLGIKAILKYHKRWYKRLKKCPDYMVVRYEDMVSNKVEIFNDIVNFMGFAPSIKNLFESIKFCEFDKLKKEIENPNGVLADHPELADFKRVGKSNNGAKLRKGIVGGYVNEIGAGDLKYINAHLKKMPKKWRYYA